MATEAQRKAVSAYQKRQDNIMIRPSKEEGARIRAAAKAAGMSVQGYILGVLREKIGPTVEEDLDEQANGSTKKAPCVDTEP